MDWTEQVRRRNEEHPKIMADLGAGMSVSDAARKHGLTRARIYQIKDKFKKASKRRAEKK